MGEAADDGAGDGRSDRAGGGCSAYAQEFAVKEFGHPVEECTADEQSLIFQEMWPAVVAALQILNNELTERFKSLPMEPLRILGPRPVDYARLAVKLGFGDEECERLIRAADKGILDEREEG